MNKNYVIVMDEDGGFIFAVKVELAIPGVDGDGEKVVMYKQKEYYHSLHSLLKAEFGTGITDE